MINTSEILQTVRMITEEKLDIRTITMGISLYDCVHPDRDILYRNVYDRITTQAKDLVRTGEALEREFGIPIVNKRISVTPASLVAAACGDPVVVARAMDAAAKETGVNYIGGYTALVQKGMDSLMKGRTVFVIAHRLSTVMNSDVIMVLDHGRIIERGNHDKLIAEKGTYYRLYTGAFEME